MTEKIEYPFIDSKQRKPKHVADFFYWQEAHTDAFDKPFIIKHQAFKHLKGYVHYESTSLCAYYISEEKAVKALRKAIKKAIKCSDKF